MASIEGLAQGWAILNELIGELEESGMFIPDLTYGDLRNAKMVIEYLRSFRGEISGNQNADATLQQEIEHKLDVLKATLLSWAEKTWDRDRRENWETQFNDAINRDTDVHVEEPVSISDIPHEKDVGFFRIRLPDEIPVEVISEIAEDCEVLIHLDGDRHLQVSGKRDCVRDAMKRIGELFYGKSRFEKD